MSRAFDRRLTKLEQQAEARTAPTWFDVQGAISALQTTARGVLAACLHGQMPTPSDAGESRATWALVQRWCQAQGTTADPTEAPARLRDRVETLAARMASEYEEAGHALA